MPPSLDSTAAAGVDGAGTTRGHWSSASSRTVRIGGEACFPGCSRARSGYSFEREAWSGAPRPASTSGTETRCTSFWGN